MPSEYLPRVDPKAEHRTGPTEDERATPAEHGLGAEPDASSAKTDLVLLYASSLPAFLERTRTGGKRALMRRLFVRHYTTLLRKEVTKTRAHYVVLPAEFHSGASKPRSPWGFCCIADEGQGRVDAPS